MRIHVELLPNEAATDVAVVVDTLRSCTSAALAFDRGIRSLDFTPSLKLARRAGPGDVWYLAVTNAELTAPGRTFVFGEATLGGRWAVVSSAHLDSPGTPAEIASERLLKEAVHELGHLAGLSHCATGNCVMVPSSDSSHVDEKPLAFCASCGSKFDG